MILQGLEDLQYEEGSRDGDYESPPPLIVQLADRAAVIVDESRPFELVAQLHACVSLRHVPTALLSTIQATSGPALDRFTGLTYEQRIHLMWALSSVGASRCKLFHTLQQVRTTATAVYGVTDVPVWPSRRLMDCIL